MNPCIHNFFSLTSPQLRNSRFKENWVFPMKNIVNWVNSKMLWNIREHCIFTVQRKLTKKVSKHKLVAHYVRERHISLKYHPPHNGPLDARLWIKDLNFKNTYTKHVTWLFPPACKSFISLSCSTVWNKFPF